MDCKIFINISKLILSIVLINALVACSDNHETSSTSQAITSTPSVIQKLSGTTGGTLTAFITMDGDTDPANRIPMTIDPSGAGSASATIPGLSMGVHTIVITYQYEDGSGNIMTLATTAVTSIDLTSGSGSLSFVETDYELDAHDDDLDGVSNADELAAGSNPLDSECVLDVSKIGSCTLG